MAKEKTVVEETLSKETLELRDTDRKQQAEVATARAPADPEARKALGLD